MDVRNTEEGQVDSVSTWGGNEGVEKPDRSLQHVWPREGDRGDIC